MNKNATAFIAFTFAAAAIFVGVNHASARTTSQAPSLVTSIGIPHQGFNADNLIDQLRPLGFNRVYAVKEKNGFFHLMATNHAGEIKRLWIAKSDGKTAIF